MEENKNIGLIVSPNPKAGQVAGELLNVLNAEVVEVSFHNNVPVKKELKAYKGMNRFVAVGGDGACLKAMRIAYELMKLSPDSQMPSVFGLNCGHIGALSNDLGDIYTVKQRMEQADYKLIKPLEVSASFHDRMMYHTFFNEVILRPYGNVTRLKIEWKTNELYQKIIRGGIVLATKIGENAFNACNYTGAEEILPIPDMNHWRLSTLLAMPNDETCDKPFQSIVPDSASVCVEVVDPYGDRSAQIGGDSFYHGEEKPIVRAKKIIGSRAQTLFIDKMRVQSAKKGVYLLRE